MIVTDPCGCRSDVRNSVIFLVVHTCPKHAIITEMAKIVAMECARIRREGGP